MYNKIAVEHLHMLNLSFFALHAKGQKHKIVYSFIFFISGYKYNMFETANFYRTAS